MVNKKGQPRINNPETMATLGIQYTRNIITNRTTKSMSQMVNKMGVKVQWSSSSEKQATGPGL